MVAFFYNKNNFCKDMNFLKSKVVKIIPRIIITVIIGIAITIIARNKNGEQLPIQLMNYSPSSESLR